MTKFLHFTFIIALCLSLAGQALSQDLCADTEELKEQSIVFCNDGGMESSVEHDCECHCHHNHFEFSFFDNLNKHLAVVKKRQFFNHLLPPSYQTNSLKRPPKIIS